MNHRMTLACSLITLPLLSAPAFGQDEVPEPNSGRISLDLGVDWTSEYFFRGYLQEDDGLIIQPWIEVGFSLKEAENEDDFSLSASLGIWNSFHSEKTGANGTANDSWYEADLYGGLALGWKFLEFGVGYTFYTYPNNTAFDTVQELGLTLGIDLPEDDWTRWIGDLSLGIFIETDNSNVGPDEAVYFEFGFGPSFELMGGDATLSIPVTLGFSLDDYYVGADDDDTLGWASVGAMIEYPLGSGDFGDWTLTGGVNVLFLGDTAEAVNNDDDTAIVGFVGISMSY